MNRDDHNLKIESEERTPIVERLLSIIDVMQMQLTQQSEKIDLLLAEIRKLKKLSPKPKIKPSTLPKDPDDKDPPSTGSSGSKKRAGSLKRSKNKTLKIDVEKIIAAENVPDGAVSKGYQDYIVQDLIIETRVIKYRLERWKLPDGSEMIAKLPEEIRGHHFGTTLRAYIIHQHYHQYVTQPLLHAQLLEWGIDISTGQINRILTEGKEKFHEEKTALLKAGLSIADYIQVDDTGARHKGKNGYCTFVGNALFSWFSSTSCKSRINFLKLLRCEESEYELTEESFEYMKRYRVAPWIYDKLFASAEKTFPNEERWKQHLISLGIVNKHYIRLVTETALIGSVLNHGFSKSTVILSDDAGQFNIFLHALCWIHAERAVKALVANSDMQQQAIDWARNEIWEIYHSLLIYKLAPNEQSKTAITERFDKFCTMKTGYQTLNLRLKKFRRDKAELLLVLERPEIPIHNNQSESDIREYVKRRKISGPTRSDDGRKCRDTFISLKKTATKLGVGFWGYLIDRINNTGTVPSLPQLLILNASKG